MKSNLKINPQELKNYLEAGNNFYFGYEYTRRDGRIGSFLYQISKINNEFVFRMVQGWLYFGQYENFLDIEKIEKTINQNENVVFWYTRDQSIVYCESDSNKIINDRQAFVNLLKNGYTLIGKVTSEKSDSNTYTVMCEYKEWVLYSQKDYNVDDYVVCNIFLDDNNNICFNDEPNQLSDEVYWHIQEEYAACETDSLIYKSVGYFVDTDRQKQYKMLEWVLSKQNKDDALPTFIYEDEKMCPDHEFIVWATHREIGELSLSKVEELIQKSKELILIEDLEEDESEECPCIKVSADELPNKDIIFYFRTSVYCKYCEERGEEFCGYDDMDKTDED